LLPGLPWILLVSCSCAAHAPWDDEEDGLEGDAGDDHRVQGIRIVLLCSWTAVLFELRWVSGFLSSAAIPTHHGRIAVPDRDGDSPQSRPQKRKQPTITSAIVIALAAQPFGCHSAPGGREYLYRPVPLPPPPPPLSGPPPPLGFERTGLVASGCVEPVGPLAPG
jgi:hypothetical protein